MGAWALAFTPERPAAPPQVGDVWGCSVTMKPEAQTSQFPPHSRRIVLSRWLDTRPQQRERGGGVAVTDNCYVGQWPLCQLIHNTCHHVLSAKCLLDLIYALSVTSQRRRRCSRHVVSAVDEPSLLTDVGEPPKSLPALQPQDAGWRWGTPAWRAKSRAAKGKRKRKGHRGFGTLHAPPAAV